MKRYNKSTLRKKCILNQGCNPFIYYEVQSFSLKLEPYVLFITLTIQEIFKLNFQQDICVCVEWTLSRELIEVTTIHIQIALNLSLYIFFYVIHIKFCLTDLNTVHIIIHFLWCLFIQRLNKPKIIIQK